VLQQFVRQERLDQDRNACAATLSTTSDRMSPVMTMAGMFQASAARRALTVSTAVGRSAKIVVAYQQVGTDFLPVDSRQRVIRSGDHDRVHAFRFQQAT